MRRLADRRQLDAARMASLSADALALLDQWARAGWLHADDEGVNAMNQDEPTRAPIDSRGNFHDAVRGVSLPRRRWWGCREIPLIDDDFADWPISEREVIDDLTHWCRRTAASPWWRATSTRSRAAMLGDLAPPVRPCGALPHQQRSRSGTDAHHCSRRACFRCVCSTGCTTVASRRARPPTRCSGGKRLMRFCNAPRKRFQPLPWDSRDFLNAGYNDGRAIWGCSSSPGHAGWASSIGGIPQLLVIVRPLI